MKQMRQYIGILAAAAAYYVVHEGAHASVGLSVMMIVSSLFCRYGAEVCDGKASLESMEHAES